MIILSKVKYNCISLANILINALKTHSIFRLHIFVPECCSIFKDKNSRKRENWNKTEMKQKNEEEEEEISKNFTLN